MNVSMKFGKNQIIWNLKPTILYQLSAPSTPEEVVTQAVDKSESGEKVTVADVQKWKREAEILFSFLEGLFYREIRVIIFSVFGRSEF